MSQRATPRSLAQRIRRTKTKTGGRITLHKRIDLDCISQRDLNADHDEDLRRHQLAIAMLAGKW